MSTLHQANREWASRPDDERYLSLIDMGKHFATIRNSSIEHVQDVKQIDARVDQSGHLGVYTEQGTHTPTHYGFGQLAFQAGAPADYLRTLPIELTAQALNHGLKQRGDARSQLLFTGNRVRAMTGPTYGRIWNVDVLRALYKRFGDGVSGDFRVPGEFGQAVTVTKENTTLYASDRDCFVFLANEKDRIEMPNRREGKTGSLSQGFFCWNSEVGDRTFGFGTFLFDYVCSNRIVWGASDYKEVKIRHTKHAPERFASEISSMVDAIALRPMGPIADAVHASRLARIGDSDAVSSFLTARFGARLAPKLIAAHDNDEHRPIETLWDVTTAVTAYARTIPHINKRIGIEQQAAEVLRLAA